MPEEPALDLQGSERVETRVAAPGARETAAPRRIPCEMRLETHHLGFQIQLFTPKTARETRFACAEALRGLLRRGEADSLAISATWSAECHTFAAPTGLLRLGCGQKKG